MAMLPEGSICYENPIGTAPAVQLWASDRPSSSCCRESPCELQRLFSLYVAAGHPVRGAAPRPRRPATSSLSRTATSRPSRAGSWPTPPAAIHGIHARARLSRGMTPAWVSASRSQATDADEAELDKLLELAEADLRARLGARGRPGLLGDGGRRLMPPYFAALVNFGHSARRRDGNRRPDLPEPGRAPSRLQGPRRRSRSASSTALRWRGRLLTYLAVALLLVTGLLKTGCRGPAASGWLGHGGYLHRVPAWQDRAVALLVFHFAMKLASRLPKTRSRRRSGRARSGWQRCLGVIVILSASLHRTGHLTAMGL